MSEVFKTQNGWTKEKMKAHVKLEFKGKSEDGYGNCMYRNSNGKKCAVGMFIPDNKYHVAMDNNACNGGTNAIAVINQYNLDDLMPLIKDAMNELQAVHDKSAASETLDKMLEFVDSRVVNS